MLVTFLINFIVDTEAVSTIHISAKSFFGARHALATLQQLIWYDDEDELLRMLTTAKIHDAPKFRYVPIGINCVLQQ